MRDAKENREKKMAARNPGGEERDRYDVLSERGTTRSLPPIKSPGSARWQVNKLVSHCLAWDQQSSVNHAKCM